MMRLQALIEGLGLRLERGSGEIAVSDLVEDSRRVGPGCAFLARPGERVDGRDFITDALERGAAAIITDLAPPADLPRAGDDPAAGPAWVRAERADMRLAATLGERFFDHPSHKLALVGVTGTNGKTTTATLIQHLLTTAGVPTGLIGTLGATLPAAPAGANDDQRDEGPADEILDTGLTTPGPVDFSRLLALMHQRGCRAAVTEVSSHALAQGRVGALRFAVGVFTNLTGDHLDYHGTMDAYADAKAKLFALLGHEPGVDAANRAGWAILNADDPYAARMFEAFGGPRSHVLRCTLHAEEASPAGSTSECRATILSLAAHASRARFDGPWGSVEAMLPLVGRHNVANALQAVAAAHAVTDVGPGLGRALASCPPVPGRLERVAPTAGRGDAAPPPTVLVDYAHTHDALENVLLAVRPLTQGRLRVVFGCGGDRDRAKRPKMARVAARFADAIWVTSDNPRTEDPQRIVEDIMPGFASGDGGGAVSQSETGPSHIHVELDRAEAIAAAIRDAEPRDTVLIAGKGHEDYQVLADRTIHFDDREQAATALRQWQEEHSALWPPTR